MRFGKICQIGNKSGEEGGSRNARTVREVPTSHVSNHTAKILVLKRRSMLHE